MRSFRFIAAAALLATLANPAQAQALSTDRANTRYLPDRPFPDTLVATADWSAAVDHAQGEGLFVVATPMAALRDTLARLPHDARVLWLCKGFEAGTGLLGHQIARELLPKAQCGVLSGPSFAQEVAAGQPTALVAASADVGLTRLAVQAFHGGSLRVYMSTDPVGVEVGGAVKNVLAIACGIVHGRQLGDNARAALITRGLAEIGRLGRALGAQPITLMGLSGNEPCARAGAVQSEANVSAAIRQ